jgi:hypothetical protein
VKLKNTPDHPERNRDFGGKTVVVKFRHRRLIPCPLRGVTYSLMLKGLRDSPLSTKNGPIPLEIGPLSSFFAFTSVLFLFRELL